MTRSEMYEAVVDLFTTTPNHHLTNTARILIWPPNHGSTTKTMLTAAKQILDFINGPV